MSIIKAKEDLNKVLDDEENKVIALTGDWGTGKTHFIQELRKDKNSKLSNSLYISLFGIKEFKDVRTKLAQDAIPYIEEKGKIKELINVVKTRLEKLFGVVKIIDDLIQITLPKILEKKFIVLDDIERKHSNLDIDELFGFVDEYSNRYNSRFILILNKNELIDKDVFMKYYEKVINHEIYFRMSSEDAVNISLNVSGFPDEKYKEHFIKVVKVCEINNIRIINKIKKNVKLIFEIVRENNLFLEKMVSCFVYCCGVFYNGIDEVPKYNEIKKILEKYGLSYGGYFNRVLSKSIKEEDRLKFRRCIYLRAYLRISDSHEVEELILKHLEDGSFDLENSNEVNVFFQKCCEYNAYLEYNGLRFLWQENPRFLLKDLIFNINKLVNEFSYLTLNRFSELIGFLESIGGEEELINKLLLSWEKRIRTEKWSLKNFPDFLNVNNKVKKILEAYLNDVKEEYLLDYKFYTNSDGGFTDIEKDFLNSYTVNYLKKYICNANMIAFGNVLDFIIGCNSDKNLKKLVENFFFACKEVYEENKDKTDTRISQILCICFDKRKILHKLIDNPPEISKFDEISFYKYDNSGLQMELPFNLQ